jgi:hypothetical protein
MSFVAISGTFHVVGYSPDGDSLRFMATDPTNWSRLSGNAIRLNARGHAQLRLEAIDTLETHFEGTHQPLPLADAAMERLLGLAGILDVEWNPSHSSVTAAADGTPGFILSRNVEKNGRPVAFAYAGENTYGDGADVYVDEQVLGRALNRQLLAEGLAYPTFYQGLFSDLRAYLAEIAADATSATRGVWAEDVTNTGFDVSNPGDLSSSIVILPKLFRRLANYFEAGGTAAGFKEFLEAGNEGITILPEGHFTHFDTVVEVDGEEIKMSVLPERLVFAE